MLAQSFTGFIHQLNIDALLAQEGGLDVGGQGGRALLPVAS